jgi:hypothetical protein
MYLPHYRLERHLPDASARQFNSGAPDGFWQGELADELASVPNQFPERARLLGTVAAHDGTDIHGLEYGPERHRALRDRASILSRGLKMYQSSQISFTAHRPLFVTCSNMGIRGKQSAQAVRKLDLIWS